MLNERYVAEVEESGFLESTVSVRASLEADRLLRMKLPWDRERGRILLERLRVKWYMRRGALSGYVATTNERRSVSAALRRVLWGAAC